MVRFFAFALLAPALARLVGAAPIPLAKRAFTLQQYNAFQISDGTAGDAEAKANAVFTTPFAGVNLATVTADELDAVKTMREAAEDAETSQFNPAIDAATGAEKEALLNGKIQNKVLKLTGISQALNIQIAQAKAKGDSTTDLESKLAEEQTKLKKNIATDKATAGQPSKGITGGAAAAAPAGSTAATATAADSSATAAATATTAATAKGDDTATSAAAASTAAAAPDNNAATGGAAATAGSFKLLDYAAFQISDGTAGDAEAKANAIFTTPFAGVDLATVSADTLDAVKTIREAAEDAETSKFNPTIDAASGDAKTALQNGKTQNKVLKLTGIAQVLNIQIAQAKAKGGKHCGSRVEACRGVGFTLTMASRTKLTKNIATDKAAASQASKGVA